MVFLAMNEWFGAGDLLPMITWSLPLAALLYLAIRAASRGFVLSSTLRRYVVFVPLGFLVGTAWTLLVALLLGGMIHAFSFPILVCWQVGGLLAGAAAAWLPSRRSWPVALGITLAATGAMFWFNAYAAAPEPRVDVVLAPGISHADAERFWEEVIGTRARGGHQLRDGISGAGITDYEGTQPVITVRFRKRLSHIRRDSLIAHIERSQLVAKVLPVP